VTIIIKILKALGILIAIPIVLIILLFIGSWMYNYFTDNNYSKIIKSEEFKQLESLINTKENLQNIAVLPDTNFIVLNKTVINREAKTFGDKPELTSYLNYYKNGTQYKFKSIDSLLNSLSIKINSSELDKLTDKMAKLKIEDISFQDDSCNEIVYSWKTSAMWGSEGIIRSDCIIEESESTEKTRISIKDLSDGYYEFHR